MLLEDAAGAGAALELDGPTASVLVDRTLGGDGEGLEGASGPLRQIERGVLAYALARWLSDAGSPFRVAAVLTSGAALARALPDTPLRWPMRLRIGTAEGVASLWTQESAPVGPGRVPSWTRTLPVEVAVVGGVATLSGRDVASLGEGDVLVPDRTDVWLREGRLGGHARLVVRRSPSAWRVSLEGEEMKVLEAELDTAPGRRGAREVLVKDGDRLLEKMGDTPVTLSVELARFVLPLEEIAALAPGEVVRTGARIGERVALRAGERVVATGELVDVDGEIGIRILELPE